MQPPSPPIEPAISNGTARDNLAARLWKRAQKAAEGSAWLRGGADVSVMFVQQVASTGISAITSVMNAHGLGPSNLGLVALAQTVVGMSVSVTALGVNQTAIRYASREMSAGRTENAYEVLRWALRHRMTYLLALNLVLFAGADLIANHIWHRPELGFLLRVGLPIGLIATLANVPDIYYQSLRKFHVNAGVRVAESFVSLLGVVILWTFSWWTPFASVMVSTAAGAAGALLFLRVVPWRVLYDSADLKRFRESPRELLRFPLRAPEQDSDLPRESAEAFARTMMISSILGAITARVDYFMLGRYLPPDSSGIYSVATSVALPLSFVVSALNTALYPRMSSKQTSASMSEFTSKALKVCLAAFALAALYSAIAPRLVPFVFGARYAAATFVAYFLCFRYCLATFAAPMIVVGYGFGFARRYVAMHFMQLILVIGANAVLVPRYGVIGCAVTLVLSEVVGIIFAAFVAQSVYRSTRS